MRGHASPSEAAVWAQSGCCAELQLDMPKGERESHVALEAEGGAHLGLAEPIFGRGVSAHHGRQESIIISSVRDEVA